MIDGVIVKPLRQICDERGKVMHMLRNDDPDFTKFGEIYFSVVFPGVIKAWHLHTEMTLRYAVPVGRIKMVLFDDRKNSQTRGKFQEIALGPDCYQLVIVPPLVWNGFRGVGVEPALVANCADIPHRPDEIQRLPHDAPQIGYDWSVRHG